MPATESAFWWSCSLLVALSIVTPFVLAAHRRQRVAAARKDEAVRLGLDRPVAQFPFVDAQRCLGCGSCVDACPEGDVLGVVGGVATVINGLKCIGHGKCEEACPVGAIEVGLGDLRQRDDVPLMDEWNETTVPGLFVAGELGGLALVRNAVAQGRRVVERIVQKRRAAGSDSGGVLDVVIVGAGPAGLSAAATAREKGLRYLVLEREQDLGGTVLHYPRRKLVLVQAVDIPLWGRLKEAEYSKERMLALFEELLHRHRLEVRFGAEVQEVRRDEAGFAVHAGGSIHRARFVILALGRRGTPRKLGVPGEELAKVMYRLLEADSYRGQHVLVVGGGDSAVEAALGLARDKRNQVTLSYRREKLVRIKKRNEDRIQELIAARAVTPRFGSEVVEIRPASVLLRTGPDTHEIRNDYVFVAAGGEPPFGLLRRMGVRFGSASAPPA
jgi:thioredoxin reductase